MLKIVILDNNMNFRNSLRTFIKTFTSFENLNADVNIALVTDDLKEVKRELMKNEENYLFFVDVNLNGKSVGITVAYKIRQRLPYDNIILYGETSKENLITVFHEHIKPSDFIFPKDIKSSEFLNRIRENIVYTLRHLEEQNDVDANFYYLKTDKKHWRIDYSEIYFFESVGDRIVKLYTKDKIINFNGTLKSVMKTRGSTFFRCHKSFVVNIDNVYSYNCFEGKLFFDGKEKIWCPVSIRKSRELKNRLKKD